MIIRKSSNLRDRWIRGVCATVAACMLIASIAPGADADERRKLSILDALKIAQGRNPAFSKAGLQFESARLTYLKTMHGFGWVESFTSKIDYKREEVGDYKKNIYFTPPNTEQITIRRNRNFNTNIAWNFKRAFATGFEADLYSKFVTAESKTRSRLIGPAETLTDQSRYRYITEKVNPEVGVNLTLPLMGKDRNAGVGKRLLAESTWEQAQLKFEEAKRELVLAVRTGYYAVVKARETTRLRKRVLVEAEERLVVVRTRQSVGLATDLDISQTELSLLRNRADLADAVFSERQAFSRLNSLIGLPLDESFDLLDGLPPPPSGEMSLKEVQTDVVASSTNLKKLDEDVEQASVKVDQAKRKLDPTLAFTSNLAVEGERRDLPRALRSPEEKYSFGLSYDFPFGEKTADKVDLQLAEATLGEKVIQRDEINQSLILDATETFQEIEKLQQRLAIARQSLEVARKSLAISVAKYAEGRAEITDVIQGRQSVVNAEIEELNNVYSLAVSDAQLDRLSGASF